MGCTCSSLLFPELGTYTSDFPASFFPDYCISCQKPPIDPAFSTAHRFWWVTFSCSYSLQYCKFHFKSSSFGQCKIQMHVAQSWLPGACPLLWSALRGTDSLTLWSAWTLYSERTLGASFSNAVSMQDFRQGSRDERHVFPSENMVLVVHCHWKPAGATLHFQLPVAVGVSPKPSQPSSCSLSYFSFWELGLFLCFSCHDGIMRSRACLGNWGNHDSKDLICL